MRLSVIYFLLSLCLLVQAEDLSDFNIVDFHLEAGKSREVCFQGSMNPFSVWNTRVFNVTSRQMVPLFTVDNPDSNFIRLLSYLYEKATGNQGFNPSSLYDTITNYKENSVQLFLSPYGTTCFNITCPSSKTVIGIDVHINYFESFDSFCLIRLVLGAFILLFASKLSKSKSFYYITAASLSAIIGILLIIIYIMKKLEASNTVVGATAIAYSFGLNVLFRHSMFPTLWRLVLEHYHIVIFYTSVFAFLGIVFVRLKIFNSPTANNTSLFEVVRWALLIIGLTLVLNSSSSIGGSFICFIVMMILIELVKQLYIRLNNLFIKLRFKLFPPKHTFKTQQQYEEDRQKYTLQEMQKLRSYYLNNPVLLNQLHSCPKATMIQFLTTGLDIIDTSSSYSDIITQVNNNKDDSMIQYLYKQRNNRDLFMKNGEYSQIDNMDIHFTDVDANASLQPSRFDTYDTDEDEDEDQYTNYDRDIYQYDSDHGDTSFMKIPKRNKTIQKKMIMKEDDITERRKTLPSSQSYIPTANDWE